MIVVINSGIWWFGGCVLGFESLGFLFEDLGFHQKSSSVHHPRALAYNFRMFQFKGIKAYNKICNGFVNNHTRQCRHFLIASQSKRLWPTDSCRERSPATVLLLTCFYWEPSLTDIQNGCSSAWVVVQMKWSVIIIQRMNWKQKLIFMTKLLWLLTDQPWCQLVYLDWQPTSQSDSRKYSQRL